jgi:hypothetical protein
VTILNDNYLENLEVFSINITNYELLNTSIYFEDYPIIDLRSESTEITIEDDDG